MYKTYKNNPGADQRTAAYMVAAKRITDAMAMRGWLGIQELEGGNKLKKVL